MLQDYLQPFRIKLQAQSNGTFIVKCRPRYLKRKLVQKTPYIAVLNSRLLSRV